MDKVKILKLRSYKITIAIALITSIVTISQFVNPQVLSILRRNPESLLSGQWWRIITPLLVHSDGWMQFAINIIGIISFGFIGEQLFGGYKLLLIYLAGGLIGEIAGYIGWDAFGAGSSIGWCGILGGIIFLLFKYKNIIIPKMVYIIALYYVAGLIINVIKNYTVGTIFFVIVIVLQTYTLRQKNNCTLADNVLATYVILCGILLLFLHDIHGVAIFGGFLTAFIITKFK
ncbi:rhomboid family intramembrane serine protease [Clostridium beijerinckii]|uniref:Peptidase S54 rhomboid domain-containing protein n=2 Tax=Clostridium beijerinckii TaxID=1520 RepID=A0A1S9N3F6_CLOBE|nr:rhomboid family intramembrane serine protease [Clostridium beijerinckii]MZK53544.1 rhomboid family intramembrane serine protease [Clostridium beijerinckii]MZK60432.1 rhomboid family intramembrane serine protease [Clostridium beijerinckii]MZK70249.1 rhomboid family intramembrane serine protease [Clostridium beijerinckii]MZK76055.1 rhomboid family intramembrane serine protease [Clostridium beijerinckii]MZK85160.1 rhomboid family intramembrane serine protease [Clostridium beijerinckii]